MIIAMMHWFVMRFVINFNRCLDVSNLGLMMSILWHVVTSKTLLGVMWSLNIVRSSLNVMRLINVVRGMSSILWFLDNVISIV